MAAGREAIIYSKHQRISASTHQPLIDAAQWGL